MKTMRILLLLLLALATDAGYAQVVSANLKTYGAKCDGTTDDSAAWTRAIAAANAQKYAAVLSGHTVNAFKLEIPPGDCNIVTGATATNLNLEIVGAGREHTRIKIGSGQYLLTASASVYNLTIRDISTSGGKGVFKQTSTSNNVLGQFLIVDNSFHDYTECAIGSLSADMPYWRISRNIFYGSSALTSKGIALAADNSKSVISDNAFERNKYHIKLGRAGVASNIANNDFIRFTDGGGVPALTDIWLVPSSFTSDGNLIVYGNKFGNENRNVADYVVLAADEAAGADFITKDHATSVSTGYVTGVTMRENQVSGAGSPTFGIIYSYTPNIAGWLVDNVYRGSQFPYVVQFDAGVTVDAERSIESNVIRGARGYLQNEPSARLNYSNVPSIGILDDTFVNYAGFDSTRTQYSVGFDPSFLDLWTTGSSGARLLNQSSTTRTNITDSIGDDDAAEYTFSASTGFAYGYIAAPTPNRQGWIEIEVKKSATNPISRLLVDVRYDANVKIPFRRIVNLSTSWQRIRFPWTPRSNSAIQHIEFRTVTASDYSAGVSDRFQVGRIRIYHAAEPIHFGSQYLQAKATYDPPNLADGAGATTTVTVAGAALGDFAECSFSLDLQGISVTGYVSALNTASCRFQNESGGALDLASGTLRARIRKQ